MWLFSVVIIIIIIISSSSSIVVIAMCTSTPTLVSRNRSVFTPREQNKNTV